MQEDQHSLKAAKLFTKACDGGEKWGCIGYNLLKQ